MESQEELMVRPVILNGFSDVVSNGNGFEREYTEQGSVHEGVDEDEKGEIADVVLEGLDDYLDDVTDRLVISRMVSDSVIKGMVTAVEQEAAERIAAKELEVANLKQFLHSREVGARHKEVFSCISDACLKHEKSREELYAWRKLTRELLKKAKKEVEHGRGANSVMKIGSGFGSVGLGGIFQEKQCGGCVHVDKMLEGLEATVDDFSSKVDDILVSSEITLCEAQEDRDVLGKIEDIVMQSVIKSLQEETNAQSEIIQNVNWLENFKGISEICTQLKEIQKSPCMNETRLVSYVSHDLDHLHPEAFGILVGENGKVDESNVHVAESYDFQQLKHLTREKMVEYFNGIITKLKRDHESVLEQNTDKYYRLKREFLNLKERPPSTTHKKNEEFDMIRKRIPEIISKLEGFLLENEKFPALTKNLQSVKKLKLQLDSLLIKNHQLRESLNEKEKEVRCLEAQVSSAAEASLQSSLAEQNLIKLVENLNSSLENSFLEASLTDEVYKSSLREQLSQMRLASGDSNMEICDTILRDSPNRYESEDSDIESWIMKELSGLVFTEAIMEIRNCVETTALEKEHELRLVVEENKNFKQDIQDLRTALEQKEKFAIDLSFSLSEETKKLEVASQECSSLRELASRLQKQVTESEINLELLRSQHSEALKEIKLDKMELLKAKQNIDETKQVLSEVNREKSRALIEAQEVHDKLALSVAREATLKKEMISAISQLSELFDDFECRISEATQKNIIRFKDTSSHLKALKKVTIDLKQTYQQKLDMKSVNLLKAESEVDLLGDEVESLLRLLNKIYIALDHYSPVLKHYAGIVEILALVKRELSGQSAVV